MPCVLDDAAVSRTAPSIDAADYSPTNLPSTHAAACGSDDDTGFVEVRRQKKGQVRAPGT